MKIYHNAIKNLKVSSKYGKRTHPITGEKNKMHYGTDIYTNGTDKNIYALEDGYVQKTVKNQSNATTGVGLNSSDFEYDIYEAITGICKVEKAIHKTKFKN